MGKNKLLLLLLLLCLTLSACAREPVDQVPTDVPPVEEQTPDTPPVPETPEVPDEPADQPVALDHLTVELVVDWADSDGMLSRLEDLSRLLKEALADRGYEAEEITVTISTAGGFTAEALVEGGVDIACLPGVDFVACEAGAAAVLTTDQAVPTSVLAVTAARDELDQSFREALADALTGTEAGTEFLTICHEGETFVPATETALQALRDWAAQQEAN